MLGLHRTRQWISLPGALAGTIFILPLVLGLVVLQTRTTWIGLLFTASSAGRFRAIPLRIVLLVSRCVKRGVAQRCHVPRTQTVLM